MSAGFRRCISPLTAQIRTSNCTPSATSTKNGSKKKAKPTESPGSLRARKKCARSPNWMRSPSAPGTARMRPASSPRSTRASTCSVKSQWRRTLRKPRKCCAPQSETEKFSPWDSCGGSGGTARLPRILRKQARWARSISQRRNISAGTQSRRLVRGQVPLGRRSSHRPRRTCHRPSALPHGQSPSPLGLRRNL